MRILIAIAFLAAALAGAAQADTLTLQVGDRVDEHRGVVVQVQQSSLLARVDFGSTGYVSWTSKTLPAAGLGNWTVVVNGLAYQGCELTRTRYLAQGEISMTFGCVP